MQSQKLSKIRRLNEFLNDTASNDQADLVMTIFVVLVVAAVETFFHAHLSLSISTPKTRQPGILSLNCYFEK